MIAEESTAWPMVIEAPRMTGGLGFNYQMEYGLDERYAPVYLYWTRSVRAFNHDLLTFSYVVLPFRKTSFCPISHDEVVLRQRLSCINKMRGQLRGRKICRTCRAFLGYMMAHPGKKLLFMGQRIRPVQASGTMKLGLDWLLLDYAEPTNGCCASMSQDPESRCTGRLPLCGRTTSRGRASSWIAHDDYAAKRDRIPPHRPATGKEIVATLATSAPVQRNDYKIGVPKEGRYQTVFNTDAAVYGGNGITEKKFETTADFHARL